MHLCAPLIFCKTDDRECSYGLICDPCQTVVEVPLCFKPNNPSNVGVRGRSRVSAPKTVPELPREDRLRQGGLQGGGGPDRGPVILQEQQHQQVRVYAL